jgi:pSer/pThr/pTyr-binding forkhead associated (FHA) protein
MVKLTIQSGPDANREFPVAESTTTIGRAAQNNVVLHDTYAGRKHAEIRKVAEGYAIVDLNSRNGTQVNDARIAASQVLQPGDRITIGETVLLFEEGAVAPVQAEGRPVGRQSNLLPVFGLVGVLLVATLVIVLSRGTTVPTTTPTATATAVATATAPAVAPTATPVPTRTEAPTTVPVAVATATPPVLCPDPNLRITLPAAGAEVGGVVEIYGTASIAEFAYYKLEFGAAPVPSAWSTIGEVVHSPARDARLGIWDTTALPAGDYILRLVAVDQSGNYPAPCEVALHIKN